MFPLIQQRQPGNVSPPFLGFSEIARTPLPPTLAAPDFLRVVSLRYSFVAEFSIGKTSMSRGMWSL